MTTVRTFNEQGLAEFRACLQAMRDGEMSSVPTVLLTREDLSGEIQPIAVIDRRSFSSKHELARYLTERIAPATRLGSYEDVGLWCWLTAFYFDVLCPAGAGGLRSPGADHRYIPSGGREWKSAHRHLVLGPVRVFGYHGTAAGVLLAGSLHHLPEFVEQLQSRQEVVTNRGVVEAANLMYLDTRTGNPKRGAAPNQRRPGTLRRFVDLIQQLELTFDLQSMTGAEILSLLPEEFDDWRPRPGQDPASLAVRDAATNAL